MTEQFHLFCDEAGTTQDQFLVVAGIVVPDSSLQRIESDMKILRSKLLMFSELKWQKITNQKEKEYKAFIDYFFTQNERGRMDFHNLIVPYHRFDHRTLNDNDRNVSLHKMYYEFILHRFCRYYGKGGNRLLVHPDTSTVPFCGPTACRMLNLGLRKSYQITGNPVRAIEPMDSKQSNILQINDIVLGAVCAHRNRRHLKAGGRQAKRRLAEYVLERAGLKSFERDTPISAPKRFTVWNLRSPLLRESS